MSRRRFSQDLARPVRALVCLGGAQAALWCFFREVQVERIFSFRVFLRLLVLVPVVGLTGCAAFWTYPARVPSRTVCSAGDAANCWPESATGAVYDDAPGYRWYSGYPVYGGYGGYDGYDGNYGYPGRSRPRDQDRRPVPPPEPSVAVSTAPSGRRPSPLDGFGHGRAGSTPWDSGAPRGTEGARRYPDRGRSMGHPRGSVPRGQRSAEAPTEGPGLVQDGRPATRSTGDPQVSPMTRERSSTGWSPARPGLPTRGGDVERGRGTPSRQVSVPRSTDTYVSSRSAQGMSESRSAPSSEPSSSGRQTPLPSSPPASDQVQPSGGSPRESSPARQGQSARGARDGE
jgi:hypothetical protein